MSAATSSLKQQAAELVQAVAVFRLSEALALPVEDAPASVYAIA
jgi:hypothetical protein